MNRDTIDEISSIINEKLAQIYNTAVAMANVQLLSHYKDTPDGWKKRQLKEVPQLKNDINRMIRKEIDSVMIAVERAVFLAYKVADGTYKSIDTNQEKIEVKADKIATRKVKQMKTMVINAVNGIPNAVQKMQYNNINDTYNRFNKREKSTQNIDRLFKEILHQTQDGVANAPKKVYRDGKEVGYREYMEMNVRTTFQHDAGDFQLQASKDAGVIFFLCSSHATCANDHVDYQGKMYVDEDWESMVDDSLKEEVANYIKANNIETIQRVRDDAPYLTTRPNCRHYFMPINTEEAIGTSTNKLLKENNMILGKYDQQNYVDLQKQRYEERTIRHLKTKLDERKAELEKLPNGKQKDEIQRDILRKEKSIRRHQANIRELVKENDNLTREYDRENPRKIINDLGVRFVSDYYKK